MQSSGEFPSPVIVTLHKIDTNSVKFNASHVSFDVSKSCRPHDGPRRIISRALASADTATSPDYIACEFTPGKKLRPRRQCK